MRAPSAVFEDRAIGRLLAGDIEAVVLPAGATPHKTEFSRDAVAKMLSDALDKKPALRAEANETVAQARALIAAVNDKLGDAAPDLRPLYNLANAVVTLLPIEATADEGGEEGGRRRGRRQRRRWSAARAVGRRDIARRSAARH